MCIYPGSDSDDLNPLTFLDYVDENCFCGGFEVTGIDESSASSISIYPNPCAHSFTITIDESLINASYQLFDAQGRMVNEGVLTSTNTTLNTTELATGNYVISIGNDQGVVRQQFLMER